MHLLAAVSLSTLCSPAAAQSFNYPDFTDWSGISPVGLTTQAGAVLQLQDNVAPAVNSDNRGAAWYQVAVPVVNGFDTTFVYRMHTPAQGGGWGSDGLAFVIQNDLLPCSLPIVNGFPDGTGNKAIGRHAAAAGFGQFADSPVGDSVDNSLAIHFDTFLNPVWGDPDDNHISVHTGGKVDNHQDESFSLGRVSPTTNLNDGSPHTVRVLYVPGALSIYLDGNLELSVPYGFTSGGVWVDSGFEVGGLDLIGGTSAYVGFTSGAGTAREYRDILSWSWTSSPSGPLVAPLDIRPGACPNRFNPSSHGFLQVALLGTATFDPGLVDLATLRLGRADGVGQSIAPNLAPPGPKARFEDVATPLLGSPCECDSQGCDGLIDLVMWFRSQELVGAFQLGTQPTGPLVPLELSGALLDGTPFSATDCLLLVPRPDARSPKKR